MAHIWKKCVEPGERRVTTHPVWYLHMPHVHASLYILLSWPCHVGETGEGDWKRMLSCSREEEHAQRRMEGQKESARDCKRDLSDWEKHTGSKEFDAP